MSFALDPMAHWYAKKINKPYEVPHAPYDAGVWVNVYAAVGTVSASPSALTKRNAVLLILDYYGKSCDAASLTIADSAIAVKDIYSPRAGANNIILYTIRKNDLDGLPDRFPSEAPFHTSGGYGSRQERWIKRTRIAKFLQHLRTSFPVYQQQMKFYKGSISPDLNFLELLHQAELFFENLENFVTFNGHKWEDQAFLEVNWAAASAVPWEVQPPPAAPPFAEPERGSPLRGLQYIDDVNSYSEDPAGNPLKHIARFSRGYNFHFVQVPAAHGVSLQSILQNIDDILSERRNQINWKQFVYHYLPHIKVNPHGKPKTPKVWEELSARSEATELGTLGATEAEAARDTTQVNDARTAERAFQEANKEIAEKETGLQAELDTFVNEIENVAMEADAVMKVLNKYNVTALMEAALECLLFHTPGYSGTMPDFVPGIDPFMPKPPRMRIRFPRIPTRMVIPSINKQFRLQLRNGLRLAALNAIASMIGTLADLIRAMCLNGGNANDVPSEPIDDAARNFIDPLALANSPTGDPLGECYEDAGLSDNVEELTAFFAELSPLISAREMCDLLNGNASYDVKQVVDNLLDTAPYAAIRTRLTDIDAAMQLFQCIGNIMDPALCQNIYNAACAPLPTADPCLVNDMPAWLDLVELLENVGDLFNQPDMSCGGPIVPSPADHPPFVHTITDVIDAVVSAAQQTFLSDLGGFKQNLLVIDPTNPVNANTQQLLEKLQEAMSPINAAPGPDPAVGNFFQSFIPSSLQNEFPAFEEIGTQLQNLGDDVQTNIQNLQSKLTYQVAPATYDLYRTMETQFESSGFFTNPSIDPLDLASYGVGEALNHYSFATTLAISPAGSTPAAGSTAQYSGEVITYNITGKGSAAVAPTYMEHPDSDRLGIYHNLQSALTIAGVANDLDISADVNGPIIRTNRAAEAERFKTHVFSLHSLVGLPGNTDHYKISHIFQKKFYPFAYFSLINSAAYRLSESDLFNLEDLNNLNIFPRFCAGNGKIADSDLLDVDNIKIAALNEFLQAACNEEASELGPVREAALMALVNLYFQVIIVDLILKNIFMVSVYGTAYLASPALLDELLWQIQTRILGNFNFDFFSNIGLPKIVKKSAALIVRKLIVRNGTAAFSYPITHQSPALTAMVGGITESTSLTDPNLEHIAVRYMLEERLLNSQQQIKDIFDVRGDTVLETFLYEGILDVDIWDPEHGVATLYAHNLSAPLPIPSYYHVGAVPQLGMLHPLVDDTMIYEITAVSPPGAGTPVSAGHPTFYIGNNYVADAELLVDPNLVAGAPPGSPVDIALTRALDEMASYQNLGALVKERYMQLDVDMNVLNSVGASAAPGATAAVQVALVLTTAATAAAMAAMQQYFNNTEPITVNGNINTYIVPFDTFIDMMAPWAQLFAAQNGSVPLPIPFFLAGSQAVTQNPGTGNPLLGGDPSAYPDPLSSGTPLESRIQLQHPDFDPVANVWDNSSNLQLKDYQLLRFWMGAVAGCLLPSTGTGHHPDQWNEVASVHLNGGRPPSAHLRARIIPGGAGMPNHAIPFSPQLEHALDYQRVSSDGVEIIPAMQCRRIPTTQYDPVTPPNWIHRNVSSVNEAANQHRYVYSDYDLLGAHVTPNGSSTFNNSGMRNPAGSPGNGESNTQMAVAHTVLESPNFEVQSISFKRTFWDIAVGNPIPNIGSANPNLSVFPEPGYPNHPDYDYSSWIVSNPNRYPEPVMFFLRIRDKRHGGGHWRSMVDFYGDTHSPSEAYAEDQYELMKELFETYETEEEFINALDLSFGGVVIEHQLDALFPGMQMGNRIAYLTPEFPDLNSQPNPADWWENHLVASNNTSAPPTPGVLVGNADPLNHVVKKYKSFYVLQTTGGTLQAHIATQYSALADVSGALFDSDTFMSFLITAMASGIGIQTGFERWMEEIYQEVALPIIIPNLAAQPGIQQLFGANEIIDVPRILQYLYLSGEIRTYFDLFKTEDILEDTKYIILLAMQAAFAGDDYAAESNCDVSAMQNMAMNGVMDAMGPFANLGRSFLNKMLKETPKHILKGVVELTEPHVILAKMIKDLSRQGFQSLDQILAAGNSAVGLAQQLQDMPQLQLPCPDEIDVPGGLPDVPATASPVTNLNLADIIAEIQQQIDLNYPADMPSALKPQVSKENGIDLEGSLPYTFFIPPLTPFGIIYLLLQLGEFPINQVQTSDNPADCD